ncbi:MAG: M48 family metallopeptidase [Deltaproteobacteria bacterium]|nr:M48 family metallopeptidase [Deltaproteobacteria bacterium]
MIRLSRSVAFRPLCASVALVGVLALIAGCALTVEQERQLGEDFSRQVAQEMKVLRDPMVVDYVRQMGGRLAGAAGPQPFLLTFNVVVDKDLNAFAGPGGYVYVNTGLIMKVRSSSELAGVMAHEISHVTLRHVSQAVARQQQASGLGALVGAVTDSQTAGKVAGTGVGVYNLRYDRQAEAGADREGLLLMYRAGYDPRGMVNMFQLLQSTGGTKGGFLSSHPATAERLQAMQAYIAQLPPRAGLVSDDGRLQGVQSRIRSMGGG